MQASDPYHIEVRSGYSLKQYHVANYNVTHGGVLDMVMADSQLHAYVRGWDEVMPVVQPVPNPSADSTSAFSEAEAGHEKVDIMTDASVDPVAIFCTCGYHIPADIAHHLKGLIAGGDAPKGQLNNYLREWVDDALDAHIIDKINALTVKHLISGTDTSVGERVNLRSYVESHLS